MPDLGFRYSQLANSGKIRILDSGSAKSFQSQPGDGRLLRAV